jgi:hypothetical protein
MLESKWEIDAEEGRGWYYEEASLFEAQPKKPNTIKFERMLLNFLKGVPRTNGEVYEFTIRNGHLVSHANDILTKAQNDGHLQVHSSDGKPIRKGSFHIRYKEYRDEYSKVKMMIR